MNNGAVERWESLKVETLESRTIENIKMMVVVSHESSVMSMKYERSPVPYLVYPSTPGNTGQYNEQLLETGKVFNNAPDLLTAFLTNQL